MFYLVVCVYIILLLTYYNNISIKDYYYRTESFTETEKRSLGGPFRPVRMAAVHGDYQRTLFVFHMIILVKLAKIGQYKMSLFENLDSLPFGGDL